MLFENEQHQGVMIVRTQNWSEYTRYLIIHKRGAVVLDLYSEIQDNFGGTAYMWGLYVTEYERRRGAATELLKYAEKIAKCKGHKSVVIDWESKETPREILEWYKRCGYVVIGHYRDEQYTLEKKL